jgi:hypothetical protein
MVLGRLKWKWWSKGHLRCLVEAIKRVDQESKQHPKESKSLKFKWFLTLGAFKQAIINDEASQPQQEVHLIISCSHYIWVKNVFHYWWLVFTKLIIGLHIAIGETNWNICDYPLLQYSKGIIVICMIISSLTSMQLRHIVHAY